MTYRYLELMLGRRIRNLDLTGAAVIIPLDSEGSELPCKGDAEDMQLWCRTVLHYELADGVCYATLSDGTNKEIKYK